MQRAALPHRAESAHAGLLARSRRKTQAFYFACVLTLPQSHASTIAILVNELDAVSYERGNEAHKQMGRTAKAVFNLETKTIRTIAKLRILAWLIDADEAPSR